MMKSPCNYELDLHNYALAIKWRIQATAYQRDVICKISLFPENITKLERLELQDEFRRSIHPELMHLQLGDEMCN